MGSAGSAGLHRQCGAQTAARGTGARAEGRPDQRPGCGVRALGGSDGVRGGIQVFPLEVFSSSCQAKFCDGGATYCAEHCACGSLRDGPDWS